VVRAKLVLIGLKVYPLQGDLTSLGI
jgi:hypothetical protein